MVIIQPILQRGKNIDQEIRISCVGLTVRKRKEWLRNPSVGLKISFFHAK